MSDILYELTELKGDDVRAGNYLRPANYRLLDFCEGCPLAEGLCKPQVSRIREALRPVTEGNVRHIGSFGDYAASVLILGDKDDSEFEPVYLGEEPIISPFSVEHESPTSQVLGAAHRAVDACEGPPTKKRLFRSDLQVCVSGLIRAKDYRQMGQRLVVPREGLNDASRIVVDENTADRMAELVKSAHARETAGRPLRDPFTTAESLRTMGALHETILKLTSVAPAS